MSTNFPTALDTFTNPTSTDYLNSPSHSGQHANANDAIEAIEEFIGKNGVAIGKLMNPVGTIREFNVATNPAILLGFGTWSAYGTGRVTVAIDAGQTEFDTVDETGGAKTHTLTSSESGMISHTHPMNIKQSGTEASGYGLKTPADGFANRAFVDGAVNSTSAAGPANASSAHNNLQPYIVVYRWVRTA